jgi:hypothetical protein
VRVEGRDFLIEPALRADMALVAAQRRLLRQSRLAKLALSRLIGLQNHGWNASLWRIVLKKSFWGEERKS